eukprot:6456125-Amphidinium_carterae.1
MGGSVQSSIALRGQQNQGVWRQRHDLLGDVHGMRCPMESLRHGRRFQEGGQDENNAERKSEGHSGHVCGQQSSSAEVSKLQYTHGAKNGACEWHGILGMQSLPGVPSNSSRTNVVTTGSGSDEDFHSYGECGGGTCGDVGRLDEQTRLFDAYVDYDLPTHLVLALLNKASADVTDMSSKTDMSPVDSNAPQICHVVSDSQWYDEGLTLREVEALWISHCCSSQVGVNAKQHMQNIGGIYLIESACQPSIEDSLDWLGPFMCSHAQGGRVWVQTNDVECARLCQKKDTLPNQKRMRRALAVGLRDHGLGWGSGTHLHVCSNFPVSDSIEDPSEEEQSDQEDNPTQHQVESPSPGQLRMIQRVHENLGHPRRGDFLRTLRLGG